MARSRSSRIISSSTLPVIFTPDPIVAAARVRSASRLAAPALLLGALALMPVESVFAAPTFTESVVSTTANGAFSVHAADFDGDGDVDLVSASAYDDKIAWYENDGNENFTLHTIDNTADAAYSVFTIDLDGDGDVDVLSASFGDDTIAWYENDGVANFTLHTISTVPNGPYVVYASDLDSDGDVDVYSASFIDGKIYAYQNDGSENFTLRTIDATAAHARSVYTDDVDGDGDMDVLSAASTDNRIAWHENDGNENFTLHTISTTASGALAVSTADLDGDGDVDVISGSRLDDKVAWYENDGNENFTLRTISTGADAVYSIFATDLDGDGDVDVLSASQNDSELTWYENDGASDPSFTTRIISTARDGVRSVYATDVNGDGTVDVLSAAGFSDTIAVYFNQPPPPDTTPDQFTFVDKTGVALTSSQFSAPVTITGIDAPAVINVSGPGRPAYQLGCTGNFTNSPGLVQPGQTVCAFHTAASTFGTTRDTLITIGGVSDTFSTTTLAADTTPDAFTFMDQTNVPRNSVRTSNAVTISGINAPAAISIVGGGYSIGCTGTFTTAAGTINSGQTVCVRHTSSASYNSGVNTILTVGGVSDTFTSVTTKNAVAQLLGVVLQVITGLVGTVLGILNP